MNDVADTNARLDDLVEDQILTYGKAAVPRPQFVAAASRRRVAAENTKVIEQAVYKSIGCTLAILRDVRPYLGDVPAGPGR